MFRMMFLVHILCSFAQADVAGFSRGSEFIGTSIQGQVRVNCNGFNGSATAVYNCRDIALEPNPYDHFIGPKDSRLDKIDLTAFHEAGTNRNKLMGYDGIRGKSREAFNLWISTIFQKPILAFGLNTIRYKLYSDYNSTVVEGNFNVVVKRGFARQCQSMQYDSSDINDCNSQYSICQRYFNEQKNCQ